MEGAENGVNGAAVAVVAEKAPGLCPAYNHYAESRDLPPVVTKKGLEKDNQSAPPQVGVRVECGLRVHFAGDHVSPHHGGVAWRFDGGCPWKGAPTVPAVYEVRRDPEPS